MRRAAFLPAVLIVPFATTYALDPSKSQPAHFFITFTIGVVCAAVVVSISWHAARRQIAERSRSTLEVANDKLVWVTAMGRSVMALDSIAAVRVTQRKHTVRSLVLILDDGRRIELRGYTNMDNLLACLQAHVPQESIRFTRWFEL